MGSGCSHCIEWLGGKNRTFSVFTGHCGDLWAVQGCFHDAQLSPDLCSALP